jgi:hypothetical protein
MHYILTQTNALQGSYEKFFMIVLKIRSFLDAFMLDNLRRIIANLRKILIKDINGTSLLNLPQKRI